MKLHGKFFFLFLIPIALVSCQSTPAEEEPTATPLSQPAPEKTIPVSTNPDLDTVNTTFEPELTATAPDPEDLIGREPKVIQALLGPVSLKRWEGAVQVMQFANDHCVMDIYFYESAPGEAFEASYMNARLKDGSEISTDVCLAALLPNGVWPQSFRESILSGQ